jgi:hypothetical protein
MGPVPGNKLPGYDHSIPPGQSPIRRHADTPSGTTLNPWLKLLFPYLGVLHLPMISMQPRLWIGEQPGNVRTDAN